MLRLVSTLADMRSYKEDEDGVEELGMTTAQCRRLQTRRGLVRAGLGLGSALLASPALAQSAPADASLRRVVRMSQLRFVLNPSLLNLPVPPLAPQLPLDDPFGARLGQLLAEALGVRAVQLAGAQPGQGPQLLHAGEVDVIIAPPHSRFALRQMQLAPPVLEQDIVILGPDGPPRRRMVNWTGRQLGLLSPFPQVLAERGLPIELARPVTYADLHQAEAGLLAGQVEGLLLAEHQARALRVRQPQAGWVVRTQLAPVTFAPALALGAHDLLQAMRQIVARLHADGSLAALQHIYMPGAQVPPLLHG